MDAKLIKASPPKVEWIDLFSGQKPNDGIHLVYGLVNEGSPHECFASFYARYDNGSGKWYDVHGDVTNQKITHFLRLKM